MLRLGVKIYNLLGKGGTKVGQCLTAQSLWCGAPSGWPHCIADAEDSMVVNLTDEDGAVVGHCVSGIMLCAVLVIRWSNYDYSRCMLRGQPI